MEAIKKVHLRPMWNESPAEPPLGFLEKHLKNFDPCQPYEPLTQAELRRKRLVVGQKIANGEK